MCGRYARFTPAAALADLFKATDRTSSAPSYNVAPTDRQPVVRTDADGERVLTDLRWGLIPSWSRDPRETERSYSLINARAETVADKPSFKAAFRQRRCLVPADGFFEWQGQGGGPKQPYWIQAADGKPLAFAGLWERWRGELDGVSGAITSFTIIVGEPNALVAPLHDRMPVILAPEDWSRWLAPEGDDPATLRPLLAPYPADAMLAMPVSTKVNDPTKDGPDVIES